jgi:hypothetical protein
MPHAGRPRQSCEVKELRESSKAQRKCLVEKIRQSRGRPTLFEFAWEAATVLHTLEQPRLPDALQAVCEDRVQLLRRTHIGVAVDSYRTRRDADFLEEFIRECAPGWDWRKQTLNRDQTEERYIQELAQTHREARAHANRHVLPERPDPSRLIFLANRIKPNDRTTWATLKDLKLSTGMSERTIRYTINKSRPKKSELIAKTPRRFAPRLALRVVEEFVKRLPELKIDEQQRADCIAAARQLRQRLTIAV